MKKIGVLFGLENTFPGALVDRINGLEIEGLRAEFVTLGGVRMAASADYSVIVDRISHDMPFYRSFLKNASLAGTHVINDPFWWSADDKFFNYALATKLGVMVPHTVLLPHKEHPPQINERSLRNLEFPLDWESLFDYVGFPAYLKPHDGGGWRDVFPVGSREEFFDAYDHTGDLCMMLQAAVDYTEYFRCFVVGREEVRIMPYDPRRPHEERYLMKAPDSDKKLLKRVEKDALTLCRALGYDLNTVEFAVKDGVPYAIDFMNPAPDADLHSIGKDNFDWIVDAVAQLAVKKAQGKDTRQQRWTPLLAAAEAPVKKAKAAKSSTSSGKRSAKKTTKKKEKPKT